MDELIKRICAKMVRYNLGEFEKLSEKEQKRLLQVETYISVDTLCL